MDKRDRAAARRRPARTAGFTVVETAVTLMIFTVVVVMAAPAFTYMIGKNGAMAAESEFVNALNFARSEAMRSGKQVAVRPGAFGSAAAFAQGWTIFVDTNADLQQQLTEATLRTESPFAGGVVFSSQAAIGFTPRGYVAGGAAQSYKICSSSAAGSATGFIVQVLPGGVIDVQEGSGASSTSCP